MRFLLLLLCAMLAACSAPADKTRTISPSSDPSLPRMQIDGIEAVLVRQSKPAFVEMDVPDTEERRARHIEIAITAAASLSGCKAAFLENDGSILSYRVLGARPVRIPVELTC